MPKPETIDRFRVSCEVPNEQLGRIVAEMTRMGLEQISYELITDVAAFKKRQRYDVSGADFARAFMKDHPTFRRRELIEHFEAAGRGRMAALSSIQRLREDGDIKALSPGNYSRTDIKAIAPPKAKDGAKAKAKTKAPVSKKTGKAIERKPNTVSRYDTSNIDLLLAKVRNRRSFTTKEMEDYFEANGRPRKSVSPVLNKLISMHKVRRLSAGEYAVVKVKLTPPSKANGAAAPAPASTDQETVTNG